MTRIFPAFLIAVALATPAAAQSVDPVDAGDPVEAILSSAAEDCASFENGRFDPGNAVQSVNLNNLPPLDTVVDSSEFSCSSMASAYCGTGGCRLWTVVDGQTAEFQAEAWDVIDWLEGPILLVMRDGGWCGGYGAQYCFEAVNWLGDQMMTVMPRP